MENEIQVFENEEFGRVRLMEIDGEPWFAGRDVAESLGYSNAKDAIAKHVCDEDKQLILRSQNATLEIPNRGLVMINESGLYSLILSSRLPSAKSFKHWITGEVLPSIRRHGAYMTDNLLEQVMQRPDVVLQMAQVLVKTNEEKQALTEQLQSAQPKADYFDQFVNPDDCTNIRNTAKELGIPEKQFVIFLLEHHYLYRDQQHRLMPHGQYLQKGWFSLRDVYRADGKMLQQTMFTCRGKNHFRQLLKRGELA